jgi:tRNA(Ile)-lysidine synthase
MTDRLISRVAAHCARHDLLSRGPVLAMVSGGADSTCLLHVLAEIHGRGLGVLAVDHGLRPEAAAEAEAVARASEALGCSAHVVRLGLEPGPALQERARGARLAAARQLAADLGYAAVATGHTASDQAETVLFRLARGTGRTGALGMAPRDGDLIRPLLGLTRDETRGWCTARGIAFVDDPSNADRAFARARVRHDLVPALAGVHPGAERHVAAFADRLRDEAILIEELVDRAWERCATAEGLVVEALIAEAPALRPLIVRRLMDRAGLPGEARAGDAVGRVIAAAAEGRRTEVPGGVAFVERGTLVVEAPAPPPPPSATLRVPGVAWFGPVRVRADRGVAGAPRADRVAVAADDPLVVRPPAAGDRLALPGGGHQAVGRLLAAAGVPARRRPYVPVVASGDAVVWVAGHRADAGRLAPAGAPATILSIEAA